MNVCEFYYTVYLGQQYNNVRIVLQTNVVMSVETTSVHPTVESPALIGVYASYLIQSGLYPAKTIRVWQRAVEIHVFSPPDL